MVTLIKGEVLSPEICRGGGGGVWKLRGKLECLQFGNEII